jgi:hypothetical protein
VDDGILSGLRCSSTSGGSSRSPLLRVDMQQHLSVHGKGDFRILEVLALLMAVACCQTIAIELPW